MARCADEGRRERGLLLAINVMSGGYATMDIERRYARFYQQSEMLVAARAPRWQPLRSAKRRAAN
jgi:hypothetical protein